jgi:hypothetical protein
MAILFVLILSSPLARRAMGIITLAVLAFAFYIGSQRHITPAAEQMPRPECRRIGQKDCAIRNPYFEQRQPYFEQAQPYYETPRIASPKPRPYIQR